MVEHKNGRALPVQVINTFNLKVQAGKRAADVTQQAGELIGIAELVAPQSLAQHADGRRGNDSLCGKHRARNVFHAGHAARREL